MSLLNRKSNLDLVGQFAKPEIQDSLTSQVLSPDGVQQDEMVGHVDINPNKFTDDSYYVSCLVFLNPMITKYTIGNGLTVGDEEIENVFNRLVIFDGRTWHKADTPIDNFVRLTGYFSFSNIKGLRASSYQQKNVWHR